MRRRLTPLLLVLAVLVLALASVAAPGPAVAAPTTPTVRATVQTCGLVTSRKLTGVSFSAEMAYLAGADAMWMRFELFTRIPGEGGFTRLPNSGEGWYREKAVKVFSYTDKIFALPNLSSPADYRARVTFRWNDASGRPLLTTRRMTPPCRLEPQPNLSLGNPTTQAAGQPGLLRYTIPVRNVGRADAGTFDVALRIGGEDRPTIAVTDLPAAASQPVTFTAPRCAAGDVLRFEVDPGGRVSESDESDNVLTVACPATA